MTCFSLNARVLVYCYGEMEIVEKILEIERIQKERKKKNKLLTYNTGEIKHLKQKFNLDIMINLCKN